MKRKDNDRMGVNMIKPLMWVLFWWLIPFLWVSDAADNRAERESGDYLGEYANLQARASAALRGDDWAEYNNVKQKMAVLDKKHWHDNETGYYRKVKR